MRPAATSTGEVVLACRDLDETAAFFTDELGFRLDMVMPADDPAAAVVSGNGLRVRLERGGEGGPGHLRLASDELHDRFAGPLVAPNGTVIDLVPTEAPMVVPELAAVLEVTRATDHDTGGVGRAAMRYRDLLPRRQGGRFIASHITIPNAGPVPDYVHHHRIRFQVIYCRRGWVRVVYEDQGPPLVLEAGDCVLQPSGIRHRVLESSAGLEVIEVTSPAEHATYVDHDLELPTTDVRPERTFDGQRFVHHRAGDAVWAPWRSEGFEARDTGVADATGGLAGVRVVRATDVHAATPWGQHDDELRFWYVTAGTGTVRLDGRPDEHLGPDDAIAVPAGLDHALTACSGDLELVEVTVAGASPAGLRQTSV